MRTLCMTLALILALAIVGCEDSGATDSGTMTKAEAQARAESNAGKSDSDEDYDVCLEYGWYDDGLCDPWCLEPDGDCDPCVYERVYCDVGELSLDTDDNDCIDTCEPDPDYHAPYQVALGEPCVFVDDCGHDAYCAKEMGRCDDREPGVCELMPVCDEADMGIFSEDSVCGCAGISHWNACWANSLGINIDHEGLCD